MRDIRNMHSENERSVCVSVDKLLKQLKENRDQHLKEYNEAVEGYLETAKEQLDVEFKKAQKKLQEAYDRTEEELKRFDPEKAQDTIVFCRAIQFTLQAPRNFVDAYDQAIEMMEWEEEETVQLSTTEFRCFIMNKWDWMEEFKTVSEMYSNKLR